jgi:hypothetical protein
MQKNMIENLSEQPTPIIKKRIRTTNYIVGIHFSTTNNEDVRDKVLRLIKNDMAKNQSPINQQ